MKWTARPRTHTALWPIVLMFAVVLAGCAEGEQPPPQTTGPAPTVAAITPSETMPIVIDEPAEGTTITSPFVIRGRLFDTPSEGGLSYRILDADNIVLASGTVATSGEVGSAGQFEANAVYTALVAGPGFLQIVQRNQLDGPAVAVATLPINMTANVTTPATAESLVTPVAPSEPTPEVPPLVSPIPSLVPATATAPSPTPPQNQTITITSPPPGTTIGSPMTITGNTSRFPFLGTLYYRFVDGSNRQIGAGNFAVNGAPNQASSFVAELGLQLPQSGGRIRLDLYDQNNTSGQVAAIASLELNVAGPPPTPGPQQITVTSPPAGTTVGSPVTITGRTTSLPAQGNLKYRIIDRAGNQLGAGTIQASGSAGQPATFTASLVFNLPQGGGPIRLELADRDANSGQTFASTALDMVVNAAPTPVPQQQITITSPPQGTTVGSPMTITGSTVNFPTNGSLVYRVFAANNQQIGEGVFPVNGAPGQAANFNGQITFPLPPAGGDIRLEITDRAAGGNVLASSNLNLRVAPQPTATSQPYPQP